MNIKEKRNWRSFLEKWLQLFTILGVFVGGLLGSFLAYLFQGEFPYDVLAGSFVAVVILTLFQLLKVMRKKDKLPETDERVVHNVFRFFAYASHMTLAILMITLIVFTLLGNEAMPVLYLWIFFFAYVWIAGIGALVIKRR